MATPTQLKLIDFEHEISTGNVELFPSVWQATENLAAQEERTRHLALDELLKLGAPRLSPLVAYNVATRLRDPVLSFRSRIVESLANLQELTLACNEITEIKGLESLANLQSLCLDDNQITEIKGLEFLVNLHSLGLDDNLIPEDLIKVLWYNPEKFIYYYGKGAKRKEVEKRSSSV